MRFFAIDDELDDASKDAHEEQETMEAQEAQNHQQFQSALSLQVAGNEADAVAAYLQLLADYPQSLRLLRALLCGRKERHR